MNNVIRNKGAIEIKEIVNIPSSLTLNSFDFLIKRLLRKYPANAVVEFVDINKFKVTYTREETDEEYVIRETDTARQKRIKQESNIRSKFFKLINRKK